MTSKEGAQGVIPSNGAAVASEGQGRAVEKAHQDLLELARCDQESPMAVVMVKREFQGWGPGC